jgi:hypothetical protein
VIANPTQRNRLVHVLRTEVGFFDRSTGGHITDDRFGSLFNFGASGSQIHRENAYCFPHNNEDII